MTVPPDAALPVDLCCPLTSVGGGGLVSVLGPDCQILVKQFFFCPNLRLNIYQELLSC